MSEKISGPYTMDELLKMKGQTDWARLQREEAAGVFDGVDDDDFDADWSEAVASSPKGKAVD